MRVVQRAGIARLPFIMMRLDVRDTTRQEQPVDLLEHLVHVEMFRQNRNVEWHGIGAIDHRMQVLLADHVKRLPIDNTPVGRQANYRFSIHTV